jgi:hypothetical protein
MVLCKTREICVWRRRKHLALAVGLHNRSRLIVRAYGKTYCFSVRQSSSQMSTYYLMVLEDSYHQTGASAAGSWVAPYGEEDVEDEDSRG